MCTLWLEYRVGTSTATAAVVMFDIVDVVVVVKLAVMMK